MAIQSRSPKPPIRIWLGNEQTLLGGKRSEVVRQIREFRIAYSVENCSHNRVAAGARFISKLLHRVHEVRLILARKARDLVLSGVVRQMTGSAQ